MKYEVTVDQDNYPDGEPITVGGYNVTLKNHTSATLELTKDEADVLRGSYGFSVKQAKGDAAQEHPLNLGTPSPAPEEPLAHREQRAAEARAAESMAQSVDFVEDEQVQYEEPTMPDEEVNS